MIIRIKSSQRATGVFTMALISVKGWESVFCKDVDKQTAWGKDFRHFSEQYPYLKTDGIARAFLNPRSRQLNNNILIPTFIVDRQRRVRRIGFEAIRPFAPTLDEFSKADVTGDAVRPVCAVRRGSA